MIDDIKRKEQKDAEAEIEKLLAKNRPKNLAVGMSRGVQNLSFCFCVLLEFDQYFFLTLNIHNVRIPTYYQ